jgi:hypothetical protein
VINEHLNRGVDRAPRRWPLVLATLAIILAAVPATGPRSSRRIDALGASLAAIGVGGVAFALIEGTRYGWTSTAIVAPFVAGAAALAVFVVHARRAETPMLDLTLFTRCNFTAGNVETFAVCAGLAILFLIIYVQQVAGCNAMESGLTTLPVTHDVPARDGSASSPDVGGRQLHGRRPADRNGRILLFLRTGMRVAYVSDLLPALLVFALGLSLTVAPLTATVLAASPTWSRYTRFIWRSRSAPRSSASAASWVRSASSTRGPGWSSCEGRPPGRPGPAEAPGR